MTEVANDSPTGAAQTKRLFLEAADLPRHERTAFLQQACGDDQKLRERVERLLGKHEDAGGVLDSSPAGLLGIELSRGGPPPTSATEMRSAGQSPVLLTRTARYDLVRQIGEGGFGVVWLALQQEPVRRRVAVKLLRPGLIGFAAGAEAVRELLGRFERERQALAVMNHPGIARVFEAGTVEEGPHAGQPFFAMEYVEGPPLPSYADGRRLDLRRRAELLAEVCDALHHAHTKGVLHRDLKPANVLVAGEPGERPTPKVIDFGIAKLLDEASAGQASLSLTREALFIGTPQYAPPEQAAGGQVDTRGDVYSLGALGYELFVGLPPRDPEQLRDATPSELQRILCDQEPEHPARRFVKIEPRQRREISEKRSAASSAVRRALAGELGWIIARAMSPEPARRYQSADALAQDLRRYLAGQPVEAAPPGRLYRARKFAARNRAALAMAATVAVALTLGLAVSTYGLWRARAQATEAQRQAAVAEAVNAFFIDDLLGAAVPSAREGQGRDVTVREVLETASTRLAEASAPGGRLEDQPALSAAIGRALGNTYLAIGQADVAVEHLRTSVARHEATYGPEHDQTIAAVADLAWALQENRELSEAEALNRRALTHLRASRGDADGQTLLVAQRLALTLVQSGREDEAAEVLEETLARLSTAGGVRDRESLVASRLVRHQRAMQLVEAGEMEAAGRLFRAQLEEYRSVLGPDDMTTLTTQHRVGKYLLGTNHAAEALALLQDGTIRLRRLAGPSHPETLESGYLLAEAHLVCGRPDQARALAENMRKTAEAAGDTIWAGKFQKFLENIATARP